MNYNRKERLSGLRRRAEAQLYGRAKEADGLEASAPSLADLVHELEVHQVELEMQNEELRQAEQRLEASEKKYAELYHFAPVGYFTINRKGIILEANLTGASLLGVDRQCLIGKPFPAWCTLESANRLYLHVRRVLKTQQAAKCELTLKRPDGTLIEVQLESVAARDTQGAYTLCHAALSDISERKLAEASLLNRVFDYSLDMLCVAGFDGYFKRISPSFERILGWSEAELLSKPLFDFIHPDDREATRRIAQTHEEGQEAIRFENRYLCQDGGYKWISWNAHPIVAEKLIIGVARDVTERKQAETALHESEERFRIAFDGNAVAMALTAPDGKLLRVNEAFCRMMGYSEQELSRLSFYEFTHPDDIAVNRAGLQRMIDGERPSFHMEKRYIRKSGEVIWGDMNTTLVRDADGQPQYMVTHVQNITESKRAEEDLREADRRKDEFLAMLAHELRNPLAPVRNAIQVLRIAGPSDPVLIRQREIIDRQVTHMARLLDDLLDVSRITRGKISLQKQPLQIVDVLAQAVETATPLIEARRHTLYLALPSDDLRVEADPDRLVQIAGNLLTNAARYTPEGGRIWLKAALENGDEAVIRVCDTGLGIAPEVLPRIFDMFAQADQGLAHSHGGLGIGLTMVKRLVEMHGGNVEARSAGLGQGSEFIVRLPALPADLAPWPAPPPRIAERAGVPSPRRILVVDDMVDTCASMAELLSLWGHEVRTANDGAAALTAFQEFQPEVMLLDIGMPCIDGFEVARRLRQQRSDRPLMLIALTGYAQESDCLLTQEAGFDHHLSKPVDLDALRDLLTRAPA